MWLFTKSGMLSLIEDRDDSRYLIPRARIKGDIEATFPGASVDQSTGTDYRFRTWLKRGVVIDAVAEAVREIDYSNFKNSVLDRTRCTWHSSVWLVGADDQDSR